MKYEHKGVSIEFLEGSGEFCATIGGNVVVKPSLDAMKKHIDGGKKDKTVFDPPVTMLTLHPERRYDDPPNSKAADEKFRVIVTRIVVGRKRRYHPSDVAFETRTGHRHHHLIEDTPENMRKIRAFWASYEHAQKTRTELEEAAENLRKEIPFVASTAAAKERGVI